MPRWFFGLYLLLVPAPVSMADSQPRSAAAAPNYTIAFANLGPLNTDIFIAAADGSDPKPLLPHRDLDYNASFSADGRWIVFTSTRNGSADIYRAHEDGSGLARLTDDPAFDDQGALSPDGRTLAFVSSRSGNADIWLLDLSTKALRNLTQHPAGDFRPAWSPDGQWIAFSSDRASTKPQYGFITGHRTDIFLVSADGAGLRQVTHADVLAGSPAWSTDGKRLVYYEANEEGARNIMSVRRRRGTTQIVSVDLTTNERQVLTTGDGVKWSPHLFADGRVGYASGGPEGGVEFVSGAAGARGDVRNPSWSPDGRRMVFHRDVETRWPPLRSWPSADPATRMVRTGAFPSYSPDGSRLVANAIRAQAEVREVPVGSPTAGLVYNGILVMNADGSQRAVLFQDSTRSALAPAWSPRGDRIAFGVGGFFQGSSGASIADIVVMSVDGTGVKILTDGSANHGFPSWSPDGRQLVYRGASRERNGLFIIDVETRKVRVLTSGAAHDNSPSWSPKGDRIAFTSNRDGNFEIYTIRSDGTDLRRLTSVPGNDSHPAWSPDGEWIAFASARGGFKDEALLHPFNPQPYGDVYVMRADGSGVRMLTDDQFEDGTPNWVPARAGTVTRAARHNPLERIARQYVTGGILVPDGRARRARVAQP